ncbi:isochorismate synthase [Pukyongia salina]|uniref:isochorismate synthase n=1 Tax=Pukyongia salina TaxID=2094025 RepID=A0A2S0HYX1_9FLAO|nr:isochorismate synthase [Pukyongia salina]AVI51764.1 isochorismate synthase [Pukyongia salina]
MRADLLLGKLEQHYRQQLPFVIYALPGSMMVTGLFQHTKELYSTTTLSEKGFVMAPFYNSSSLPLIPVNRSEQIKADLRPLRLEGVHKEIAEDEDSRTRHIALVSKAIETLTTSELKKVVVSRKQDLPLRSFDIITFTSVLFSENTDAFRYLWFHPKTGMWCAATPELLLSVADKTFKTMSLAGTRSKVKHGDQQWTNKEIEEQELVTQAILRDLKPFTSDIEISETYTSSAATLEHLRTDISGVLDPSASIKQVVDTLHPTPAVCGTPAKKALEFIETFEGYDRAFYTGYVGPVNLDSSTSNLFVNLRCMRLSNKEASIYTGGGITVLSDPISEWKETCNKQQTMLKLLGEFL